MNYDQAGQKLGDLKLTLGKLESEDFKKSEALGEITSKVQMLTAKKQQLQS